MVGEDPAASPQLPDGVEEAAKCCGVVQVRCGAAHRPVDLRQGRSAEPVAAFAQIDEQQRRFAQVRAELRRQGASDIAHRSEGRHDQGEGGRHASLFVVLFPYGSQRHRVLADGHCDAERGAELHPDGGHRVVETRVLARVAGRGHPIAGEADLLDTDEVRRGDVRDRLSHRHSSGGGWTEQGEWRALAHRHRLPAVGVEAGRRYRHVGDRHLPRTDHLIPGHQSRHGAVADRDQEVLVRHRGKPQHPLHRVVQVDATGVEGPGLEGQVRHVAQHLGWPAEHHRERKVDGTVPEVGVFHDQMPVVAGLSQHGDGTALPRAQRLEHCQALWRDGEHVALLGFVAPELEGRHPGLVIGNRAQLQVRSPRAPVHQLRDRVGEAAGPAIVYRENRGLLAQGTALIDHLLTAALHLRVLALDRSEVQVLGTRARRHRGGRSAAESDQHGGPPQHHDAGPRRDLGLLHVLRADVAEPAGDHDRLVIAANLLAVGSHHLFLEGAEVAGQVGAAELVVEGGPSDRSLEHDLQRRGHPVRLPEVLLPGLHGAGDLQVRDGESGDSGLGLRAPSGGALVANLTPGAGRGTGKGRDGGRVVVGLDLHQDVDRLPVLGVDAGLGIGEESPPRRSGHDRCIVVVGREHAVRRLRGGVADHLEERPLLSLPIQDPLRVEDLVATVLGVRLGEHHQLHVRRVAPELAEALHQVVDLVLGQSQSELAIRVLQGFVSRPEHVHAGEGERPGSAEELLGVLEVREHRFGHTVVEEGCDFGEGLGVYSRDVVGDSALETSNLLDAADSRDLRGLRRPGRDRAQTRNHQQQPAIGLPAGLAGAVAQQALQDFPVGRVQCTLQVHEMGESRAESRDPGDPASDPSQKPGQSRLGKGGATAQVEHATPLRALGDQSWPWDAPILWRGKEGR